MYDMVTRYTFHSLHCFIYLIFHKDLLYFFYYIWTVTANFRVQISSWEKHFLVLNSPSWIENEESCTLGGVGTQIQGIYNGCALSPC